ncbi:hypothetical protein CHLNCDRAFT_143200 [Chlorella variabilis]|uniref:Uncharacterized protein n=1 Tax=Chlorella variabilis TaxID=554065 RepID=E1Z9P7_CHLVA|nr:hypothetical protein CHLNCDRAFT_143200 [Chlorella variabilis]EFN57810.1 hypothetical protein CHLNCDRAFT_143200 [Chlorella variabilis]|eukprot:XP_005849912.1 hypothetical protein CHLNCDRAFT_143200 [Chlorella variabilis]
MGDKYDKKSGISSRGTLFAGLVFGLLLGTFVLGPRFNSNRLRSTGECPRTPAAAAACRRLARVPHGKETNAALTAALNTRQQEKDAVQHELDATKKQRDDLQNEVNSLKSSKDELQKELDAAKQQKQEVENRASSSDTTLSSMKQKLNDAKTKLEEATKHLSEIPAR